MIMTREESKAFYPILQAFAEGKVIECRTKPSALSKSWQDMNEWTEMKEIEFWNNTEYRIKPEPRYLPFKDVKECWQEMQKHQPIGWIKSKEATEDVYFTITGLTNGTCGVMLNSPGGWSLSGLFDYYTFADGTPFGVKEEE